jgi:hypothetical protein
LHGCFQTLSERSGTPYSLSIAYGEARFSGAINPQA